MEFFPACYSFMVAKYNKIKCSGSVNTTLTLASWWLLSSTFVTDLKDIVTTSFYTNCRSTTCLICIPLCRIYYCFMNVKYYCFQCLYNQENYTHLFCHLSTTFEATYSLVKIEQKKMILTCFAWLNYYF